jgi:hypothetical protein
LPQPTEKSRTSFYSNPRIMSSVARLCAKK